MARRTGFREQYYTGTRNSYWAGKIGVSNPVKLCVGFGKIFLIFSGLTSSFGLGLCVELELINPDQGMLVRCPGKSIWESYSEVMVILIMIIWRISRFEAVSGLKNELRGANRVLPHSVENSFGSKNLLQRAILYRHKELFLCREDLRFGLGETIYDLVGFSLITLDQCVRLGSRCLWN